MKETTAFPHFDPNQFLTQARQYLQGSGTMPVISVRSIAPVQGTNNRLDVYFTPEILRLIYDGGDRFKKDLRAIGTYGFRGYSKGGVNGLVALSMTGNRDENFGDLVMKAKQSYFNEISSTGFRVSDENVPVKVVCHRKNGLRLLGLLDRQSGRAVIFCYGAYKK